MDDNKQVFDLLRKLSEAQNAPDHPKPNYEEPKTQERKERKYEETHNNYRNSTNVDTEKRPDPTTISTYLPAMQYVVKYTTHSEFAMSEIKQMVLEQDRKERQWFQEREQIIANQKRREQSKQQLASVLKLVGAATGSPKDQVDPSKELEGHELRVHKALSDLYAKHYTQLAELYVPLFCLRSDIERPPTIAEDRRKLVQLLKDLVSS
ncbi:hypothetical protein TRVA0_020S02014 [Trichomonascus vanleenenianus]|uniref:uncharacterized protein n=1 Tax=Trichomonascus vanleenenianus TaxID=2268995 RepID=UPI003ECB0923